MPPLNQSLWTLLIASLTAFVGYPMVIITSRIERQRKERHAERYDDPNLKRRVYGRRQLRRPKIKAPVAWGFQ
jgi:hypothetical protein